MKMAVDAERGECSDEDYNKLKTFYSSSYSFVFSYVQAFSFLINNLTMAINLYNNKKKL